MTEAEMRLYNPMITDFMSVVRRSQIGVPQNFNAFQITEDDGGTINGFQASVTVISQTLQSK